MLSHIVDDLYGVYLTEVIQPQLGAKKDDEGSSGKSGAEPDEQSAKRIRQAVYDIRYRARREGIDIEKAYNQYMSHTSMNAMEKSTVREKLGIGASGPSVKEENIPEAKRYLRVDPSKRGTGEKVYYRTYDPSKPKDVEKRHKLETKGIKTTATHYVPKGGLPYDDQAGEKHEKKYGPATGKNTVGDKDKDGTVEPDRHEYAGVKDKAIKKAIAEKPKKKEIRKESFSNWREELFEESDLIHEVSEVSSEKNKQIKEKNVNNKIEINPTINIEHVVNELGGELIESLELDEQYIVNVINYATEYFYECGLNSSGIDNLIEDVGVDEFVNYIFEVSSEFYLEEAVNVKSLSGSARKKAGVKAAHLSKTGKELKGTAKETSIRAVRTARAERKKGPEQTERQKTLARLQAAQRERNISKAKSSQAATPKKEAPAKTKKGILDRVAGAVLSGVERHKAATSAASSAFKKGLERHKAATATASHLAKETGKTAAKAGKIAAHAATSAASGAAKTAKVMKKVVTGEEVELEALDTWHPETTSGASDTNKKIQARLKEKQKKAKVTATASYLPPLEAVLKKQSVKKESFDIVEKAPPGFEKTVKKMKKHPEIDNPFALAWYMKNKGYKSHAEEVAGVPGKTVPQQTTTTKQRQTQEKQVANKQKQVSAVTQSAPPQKPNPQDKKLASIQKTQLAAKMKQVQSGIPLKDSYEIDEIYGGRYGYRTTASGRRVERDEPDEAEQLRQSDAINKMLANRRKQEAKARLSAKGRLPIKKTPES